jgi:hypothetical protein
MNFRKLFRLGPSKKELRDQISVYGFNLAEMRDAYQEQGQRVARLQAFRNGMAKALEYIAWADRTKTYGQNQAHGGQMPPRGERFFTPKEKALQVLEKMKEHKEILE